MTYFEFLDEVINLGIEAAKADYKNDKKDHLDGSVAGFEACRGKEPLELLEVLREANEYAYEAHFDRADNYWYFRCYALEVEWVINCVSCLLVNNNEPPLLSWMPTCNAMMLVSKIVGVSGLPENIISPNS
jgi:hypothetical protein